MLCCVSRLELAGAALPGIRAGVLGFERVFFPFSLLPRTFVALGWVRKVGPLPGPRLLEGTGVSSGERGASTRARRFRLARGWQAVMLGQFEVRFPRGYGFWSPPQRRTNIA